MSRHLRVPVALILLTGIAAALLLVLLPAEGAKAPEQTSSSQEQAQQEAESRVEGQVVGTAAVNVASGFQDRKVVDAPGATALAFMPDGRLLVTNREGLVLVRKGETSAVSPALDIRDKVCANSERGLLGAAVDPEFGTAGNNFVYLYYTHKKYGVCPEKAPEQMNNPVNRVSRFVMNGDEILRGTEEVLIDNIPSPNGNHNAGDLHFGNDGKLYASVGDGSCNYAAPTRCQTENEVSRYRNVLNGKILRINPDGTIPPDNPYANHPDGVACGQLNVNNARGGAAAAPGKVCRETYAMGFRNPFRFAIDPDVADAVSLRANDVGGARIEEVSQVEKGKDYGWNCREGTLVLNTTRPCPAPGMQPPIHQYNHNTGCSSITGGAFVPNNAGWPSSYRDAYLYGDYVCGRIYSLKRNPNGGYSRTSFAGGLQGGPVSFAFGPDGALYYTTYAGGGQVHRVAFVAGNKAPSASLAVTNENYGPQTKEFQFSAEKSTDPENDALTYAWDFDYDGQNFQADPNATGATAGHVYSTPGEKTAAVKVSDGKGGEEIATTKVYPGNTAPPEPVIESPVPDATFKVGQTVELRGSATDADDGPLADQSLTFEVVRHHTAPNTHTHPYNKFTGPSASFKAPGPEDLRSTNPDGNYLKIRLTATDSQGLSKTVSRDLKPATTNVRFVTRPPGFYLIVNGETIRAPRTLLAWENSVLNVYAPAQTHDGKRYVFRAWSDGKGNRHTITTPQDGAQYIARFRPR